jgi:ketosteroid isomerase-like protein
VSVRERSLDAFKRSRRIGHRSDGRIEIHEAHIASGKPMRESLHIFWRFRESHSPIPFPSSERAVQEAV